MNQIENYKKLRNDLKQSADKNYRNFSMKICNSKYQMLGVRVPQIRKYAKQISQKKIEEFIAIHPTTYEEILLRGFLIARLPYNDMLKWFDSQLEYIDNWSSCDLFCSAISKVVQKNKEDFLEKKIVEMLDNEYEFTARVGLVVLKCSYVEPDYLNYIFTTTDRLSNRKEYYIRMAIAWLISECFIKYPSITMDYLSRSKMPIWTFNKTISKICDSYRIDTKTKDFLKKMRKH